MLNKCICLPNFTGVNCEIEISNNVSISVLTTQQDSSMTSTPQNAIYGPTIPLPVISPLLNQLLDSLYQGVTDGFFSFIDYFLKMQGLGDLSKLSDQDLEMLLNIFLSTVNSEVDSFVYNMTKTNPFYDQNKTDNTLQEKISHLTENLLVLLSVQLESLINGSNSNNNNNNNNNNQNSAFSCDCLSKLILSLMNIFEQSFGLPQDMFLNTIVSELASSYIASTLFNESCSQTNSDTNSNINLSNDIILNNVENVISNLFSNQLNGLRALNSNETKQRKKRSANEKLSKSVNLVNLLMSITKQKSMPNVNNTKSRAKRATLDPIAKVLLKRFININNKNN